MVRNVLFHFLPPFLFFFFILVSKSFAADVVINEFLPHPSSINNEWVEFYNSDNTDLSGYWLDDDTNFDDDSGSSTKKSLSSISTTGNYSYIEFGSFLNNPGDYVVLFSSTGTLIDQYQYTEDPGEDVVIGRSPDGIGSFIILAAQTKGSANSPAAPSPTSIPSNTPTPTSIPTPTKTPTPTPTSKPTSTPKPSNTPIPVPTSASKQQTTTTQPTPILTKSVTKSKNNDIAPSSVLGESTENITKTPTLSPSVSNNSENSGSLFPKIIIAVGVVFMILSGILGFRIYKGKDMIPEFLWFRK